MNATAELKVTSHVGRDLLQSAASFKTEAAVVWEYVVNSLQYIDPGVSPHVQIDVRPRLRRIEIDDNGRGMDEAGLDHFFQMHAENLDRKSGQAGRGKFGTGKSAAFGIADRLRIETRRSGLLNIVELDRLAVVNSEGDDIPVDWQTKNEETSEPNGTKVIIDGVLLPRIRTAPVIEYIERHLQAFRTISPRVAVNDHVCEYREPSVALIRQFKPSDEQREVIGDAVLTVKVSRTPLEESEQGISVTAGLGNLVAVETCGIERKEFGNYLFGEIDVPVLETSESSIAPYDASRSLELNPQHPTVRVLLSYVGAKMEEIRREQVAEYKEAKKTEEARRLASEANRIAEVLNEDFRRMKERLQEIRSAAAKPGNATSLFGSSESGDDETSEWIAGTQEPGVLDKSDGAGGEADKQGQNAPEIPRKGVPSPDGIDPLDPVGGDGQKRRKPKGGFSVEYDNLGKDEYRSRYDPTKMAIIINLDHVTIASAGAGRGIEDPAFRRLSYEIAFSEYSMALGYEMAQQDPAIPADDLLYEVRSTLNRIAGASAALYR
ncbi:MAG: ATP-binding protein [Gammaproteobacteria bacterium]|nr:ATP-binding protein [Gammaproteobacteria bacterium]